MSALPCCWVGVGAKAGSVQPGASSDHRAGLHTSIAFLVRVFRIDVSCRKRIT